MKELSKDNLDFVRSYLEGGNSFLSEDYGQTDIPYIDNSQRKAILSGASVPVTGLALMATSRGDQPHEYLSKLLYATYSKNGEGNGRSNAELLMKIGLMDRVRASRVLARTYSRILGRKVNPEDFSEDDGKEVYVVGIGTLPGRKEGIYYFDKDEVKESLGLASKLRFVETDKVDYFGMINGII